MAVLPKYQLKQLFEAGDLMTEVTLNDFIDSAYNPVLVAGTDIQLTKVTTPSGDTITISSTGGGGSSVIEGPGIDITTVGSDEKISLNLDTSQTNLIINGSDQLTFAGVHIQDEGLAVGTYRTINFIGDDVLAEDSGTPNKVNVYIPTPTFASHFDTTDGTTNGIVSESGITRSTVRISSPTVEGTPFATGSAPNTPWAGTNKPAYTSADGSVTFSTAEQVTGFSVDATGDAIIYVAFQDANNSSLKTFQTTVIYQDDTFTNTDGDIEVIISDYANDTSKRKAKVTVNIIADSIFSLAGRAGGRYNVIIGMNTDTVTDGGSTYNFNSSDVFFDTNPFTPEINGNVSIAESTNSALILTKHLSGVEYYIKNSKFEIDVTDIDNLNENTQGRSASASWNFRATGTDYGLSNLQLTAWSPSVGSFPGWSNQYDQQNISYDYDTWNLNASNYRFRNSDAKIFSKVYDPWGSGAEESSPNASILIDTYVNRSTRLGEAFADETERLYRDTSSYVAWDSTKSLADVTQGPNGTGSAGTFNNGCIVGSYLVRGSQFFADNGNSAQIGTLIPNLSSYKPDKNGSNPNYSALSDIPVYHRKFYTTSGRTISNVELNFTGSFGTSGNATTALENSQMKIYIRRVATNDTGSTGHGANPLAVHGGLYESGLPANGFNDGASGIDTVGSLIRTGASSGNNVEFTFGPNDKLCDDGFWVEIQLVDSGIKLNTLNVTLKFSDGGANESAPALTPN